MRAAGAKFKERKRKEALPAKSRLVGAALQAVARREERERRAREAAGADEEKEEAIEAEMKEEDAQEKTVAEEGEDKTAENDDGAPKREIPTCKFDQYPEQRVSGSTLLTVRRSMTPDRLSSFDRLFRGSATKFATGEKVLRRDRTHCTLHRSEVRATISLGRSVRDHQTIRTWRRQCVQIASWRWLPDLSLHTRSFQAIYTAFKIEAHTNSRRNSHVIVRQNPYKHLLQIFLLFSIVLRRPRFDAQPSIIDVLDHFVPYKVVALVARSSVPRGFVVERKLGCCHSSGSGCPDASGKVGTRRRMWRAVPVHDQSTGARSFFVRKSISFVEGE